MLGTELATGMGLVEAGIFEAGTVAADKVAAGTETELCMEDPVVDMRDLEWAVVEGLVGRALPPVVVDSTTWQGLFPSQIAEQRKARYGAFLRWK